jgi:hypothetical protein
MMLFKNKFELYPHCSDASIMFVCSSVITVSMKCLLPRVAWLVGSLTYRFSLVAYVFPARVHETLERLLMTH